MGPEEMRELREVSANVTRILSYLESDPKVKKEGLVEQVDRVERQIDELEERVNELENKIAMYWFKLAFIGAGAGAIVQLLWLVLSKIYK